MTAISFLLEKTTPAFSQIGASNQIFDRCFQPTRADPVIYTAYSRPHKRRKKRVREVRKFKGDNYRDLIGADHVYPERVKNKVIFMSHVMIGTQCHITYHNISKSYAIESFMKSLLQSGHWSEVLSEHHPEMPPCHPVAAKE
jgi:hypothetical protein